MPKFDPQLVQAMRTALEEVMKGVPSKYSTVATKAYLAECILKAAAQGRTSYGEFVAAADGQLQEMIKLPFSGPFSPPFYR